MDETAMAFELPYVRAAATQEPGLVDRISVRDYTRDVEIGAYTTERGVRQRVRFNVVLEVAHHTAAENDDVDKVLNYEMIVEAIEAALADGRLNLLETLAERVASGCLADPRAARVFVRIEKLDRIPGALGVEIARTRLPEDAARLRAVPEARPERALHTQVLYLAPEILAGPDARAWIEAFAGADRAMALAIGPARPQPRAATEGALHVGLLAIDSAAWSLVDLDPRLSVVATRTELDWALKTGRRTIWAPARMVVDALPRPSADASDPAALAAWLAGAIGAETLLVSGCPPPFAAEGIEVRSVARPSDLAG